MTAPQSFRPVRPAPTEIAPLIAAVRDILQPSAIWLFGSRARGDAHPDSDWDILAVLPDDASERLTDPVLAWRIARDSGVSATVLTTKSRDLDDIWGLPNTLGYDLAREGIRLLVA